MVDKKAIAIIDIIIARYPKIGLRALVAITSEVIPKAGKRTMYTSLKIILMPAIDWVKARTPKLSLSIQVKGLK
ncbi:hypothetical protein NUACC21_00710 [Scytonema sp. NUACC21]